MRIHTVASLAVVGMGIASAGVWWVTSPGDEPSTIASDTPRIDEPPPPAVDRSHFTAGQMLMLEGRLGHARIPANGQPSTFLLANVTGPANAVGSPSPLDLTIVIDRSGSMEERGRMTNAIEAARGMIRRLRDGDRVAVIAYSDQAQLLLPTTPVDSFSRQRAEAAIAGITPVGDTCISCAMELAMQEARPQPDRVNRILLLSDGEPTVGVRDLPGFQSLAQRARMMGSTVSTVGVDIEYDERVMGTIAQFSNGRHYFVQNPGQLPPVFDQEFQSVTTAVANGIELVVDLADGVQVSQVFDRDVRREPNRIVVPLGALAPGETKTFLAELRVPTQAEGERPIADLRLRYVDLATRAQGECGGTLAAVATADPRRASELDPFVATRLSFARSGQAVREATELSDRGDFGAAQQRLATRQAEVRQEQQAATRAAPAPVRARLQRDFRTQDDVLGRRGAGFGDPGLRAPAASPAGEEAREREAIQRRQSASEALDPWAQ